MGLDNGLCPARGAGRWQLIFNGGIWLNRFKVVTWIDPRRAGQFNTCRSAINLRHSPATCGSAELIKKRSLLKLTLRPESGKTPDLRTSLSPHRYHLNKSTLGKHFI